MKLTEVIKRFRATRQYTQTDLSRLLDVDRSYIGQLEVGFSPITIEALKKLRRFMTQKEKDEVVKILQEQVKDEFLTK